MSTAKYSTKLVDRVCETCGAPFQMQMQSVTARGGRYCRVQCNPVWHNRGVYKHPLGHALSWVDRSCETCGNGFRTQVKTIAAGRGRYCSRFCNVNYVKAQPAARKARRSNLKTKYGLTESEYEELVVLQAGCCAICARPPTVKSPKYRRLVVDHCHKGGGVRKLLCTQCNIMLGMARDNPEVLRAAATYIEAHSAS